MEDTNGQPPENAQPDEEAQVEQHVKEIMDVGVPEPKPEEPAKPYDIIDPPSTAPVVASEPPAEQVAEQTPVPESAVEALPEPPVDTEIEKAVDDITKSDSDEILSSDDEAVQQAFVMKPSLTERIKNGFADWWDNPRRRFTTLGVIIAIFVTIMAVPVTRYIVLNTVGFRGYANLRVLDATTNLPLKNVTVNLAGQSGKTDVDGKVILQHLKLGKQTLTVKKLAFAGYTKAVTVGLNGTTLNDVELKAVGTQFSFVLTDFISGKPVVGGQVASGDASALSDKNGKLILTVQPSDSPKLKVLVSGKGYRTIELDIDTTVKTPTPVQLVTTTEEVFVSKQSGKYDLCSIDVDGKNKTVLLAGTGLETSNIALSVSPDNSAAALVSSRDNQRDSSGFLLSTLTIVNLQNGTTQTLDHSERINLIGWSNGRLVYELVVAGASAANPNRERLFSYDVAANKKTQLASANYFNGSTMVGDTVYYAVSGTDPSVVASFNKVNSDATGKQLIAKREVYGMYRTAYDTLTLQTSTGWASYTLGDTVLKPGNAPDGYVSRNYLDTADGSESLWVDTRDGKGVLLKYDVKTKQEVAVTSQSSLNAALRWIDNQSVIYHVSSKQETADYLLSLVAGSQPKKIVDVTNTTGLTQAN